jgi:hypothetical protein
VKKKLAIISNCAILFPVMRDKIEMEEVFAENWEQLIDEILEEGLDLIWNERVEKYEKKRLFKLDFSPKI